MVRVRTVLSVFVLSLVAAALLSLALEPVRRRSAQKLAARRSASAARRRDVRVPEPIPRRAPVVAPRPRRTPPPPPARPVPSPLVPASSSAAGNASDAGGAAAPLPDQRKGRVEGRVLSLPHFTPVRNATVVVVVWDRGGGNGRRAPSVMGKEAQTDADGLFSLDGLDGDVELLVQAPYRVPRRLRVQLVPGGTVYVEPVLHRTAAITGLVLDAESASLIGQLVSARGAEGRFMAIVQPDGRFEIRGLPAGVFEVSLYASCKGGMPPSQTVSVREGGHGEVVLHADLRSEPQAAWSSPALW